MPGKDQAVFFGRSLKPQKRVDYRALDPRLSQREERAYHEAEAQWLRLVDGIGETRPEALLRRIEESTAIGIERVSEEALGEGFCAQAVCIYDQNTKRLQQVVIELPEAWGSRPDKAEDTKSLAHELLHALHLIALDSLQPNAEGAGEKVYFTLYKNLGYVMQQKYRALTEGKDPLQVRTDVLPWCDDGQWNALWGHEKLQAAFRKIIEACPADERDYLKFRFTTEHLAYLYTAQNGDLQSRFISASFAAGFREAIRTMNRQAESPS